MDSYDTAGSAGFKRVLIRNKQLINIFDFDINS